MYEEKPSGRNDNDSIDASGALGPQAGPRSWTSLRTVVRLGAGCIYLGAPKYSHMLSGDQWHALSVPWRRPLKSNLSFSPHFLFPLRHIDPMWGLAPKSLHPTYLGV